MRKIETSHIEAGADQLAKDRLGVGGRAEGRHDLGAPLQDGIVKAEISGGHQKHSSKFIKLLFGGKGIGVDAWA
jgi:hypothetical protein